MAVTHDRYILPQASSEVLGEETDSVNHQGMLKVMAKIAKTLGPGYQITKTAFVDPSELVGTEGSGAGKVAFGKAGSNKGFGAIAGLKARGSMAFKKMKSQKAILAKDDDEQESARYTVTP